MQHIKSIIFIVVVHRSFNSSELSTVFFGSTLLFSIPFFRGIIPFFSFFIHAAKTVPDQRVKVLVYIDTTQLLTSRC